MRANNNRLIRKANKYLILNMIRQRKRVTIDMIQTFTRLSYPTVNKIVNELLDSEIIMKNGYADSNGGKPAAYLTLNINNYFAIGIDVEIPAIRFAISDLYGEVIYQYKVELTGNIEKDIVINQIFEGIDNCITGSGKDLKAFIGIGIGLPGTIDLNSNISLNIERIKGWENIDLIDIIREKYKLPVYIRNDVHLMALIENMYKVEEQCDFALVAVRQGIGMALSLEGCPYEGFYGNAGFIGHTTIIPDGNPCKCGKRGCLEVYSSKDAIVSQYKKKTGLTQELKLIDIINCANNGDENAKEILKTAAKYLGIAIANIFNILDIKTIIISGLPEVEKDIFFEEIIKTVLCNITFANEKEIKVKKSENDNELYALGGCYFVIEQFFKKPNLKLDVSVAN